MPHRDNDYMCHHSRIMFTPIVGKKKKRFFSFFYYSLLVMQQSSAQNLLKENLQSFT